MEVTLLVVLAAFFAAALTVPAGFGLSTMLTPFVLLILDPHEAVAVVAIVHGAHNLAKYLNFRSPKLIQDIEKAHRGEDFPCGPNLPGIPV